jgi:serine/threonine-protein kinase
VHEAPTVNEQLLAAMTQPAPPLKSVVPGVSVEVAAIVDRALAFDKANRWPNARSMQDAVGRAYQTSTGKPVDHAPPVSVAGKVRSVAPDAPTVAASEHGVARTTARSSRRRREIIVALGGAGMLAALIAFALTRGGGAPPEEENKPIERATPTPAAEPAATPTPAEAALPRSADAEQNPAVTMPSPSSNPLGANAPDGAAPRSQQPPPGAKAAPSARPAAPSGGRSGASAPASSTKAEAPSTGEPDIFVRRK